MSALRKALALLAVVAAAVLLPAAADAAGQFTFLQPGFTQSLYGTSPSFLGGVAFAPNGDVWADFCAFGGSGLYRWDNSTTTPVNGSNPHPLVAGSPFPSNAGCGITNHPDGFLYSNTSSGVVQINASTGVPTGLVFGAAGDALGITPDPLTGDLVWVAADGTILKAPVGGASSTFSSVTTGAFVDGIAFSPDGQYLFASWRSPGLRLTILNRAGALVQHVTLTSEPDGISFHATAPKFVVTNNTDGTMTRFDFPADDYTMAPVVTLFASGGFRGDLTQVGPDGCIYLTQDGIRYDDGTVPFGGDSVVRICGGFAPPPGVGGDTSPPVTTITLDPANPDACCWYTFGLRVSVSATDPDGDADVAETRCQLDGTPPANFDALPPGPCPYLGAGLWVSADGVHTFYAASVDKAGNKETIQSKTFKIDRTAPTSSIDPLPMFQPDPGPFNVSWTGFDATSGIKDFDVRYRVALAGGSFGPYTQWYTQTTATSAAYNPVAGSTICFSVRARDRACWQQPTYSPEVCTTAPYDDPALTRTGIWSTVSGPGYFGPGVSRSTSYNSKLTLSNLRASVVGVLATKQPGGGTIELRWNGSLKATINLNAASVQKKQLLTFTLPSVQTGTLDIVQTSYGTVDIDAAGAWKAS
jgi:hypothetical protein